MKKANKEKKAKKENFTPDEVVELLEVEAGKIRDNGRKTYQNRIEDGKQLEAAWNKLKARKGRKGHAKAFKEWHTQEFRYSDTHAKNARKLYRLTESGPFKEKIEVVDPMYLSGLHTSKIEYVLRVLESHQKAREGKWNRPEDNLEECDFLEEGIKLQFRNGGIFDLRDLSMSKLKNLIKGVLPLMAKTPSAKVTSQPSDIESTAENEDLVTLDAK